MNKNIAVVIGIVIIVAIGAIAFGLNSTSDVSEPSVTDDGNLETNSNPDESVLAPEGKKFTVTLSDGVGSKDE